MEHALKYKALMPQPRGKGLDGLFEKNAGTLKDPNPMPTQVTNPPGELVFIPKDKRPPKPSYPQFVVFEAKNIEKAFSGDDSEAFRNTVKNRLGNTCDGPQMGTTWVEERIPWGLNRSGMTDEKKNQKREEIRKSGYARWIFVCLPGSPGTGKVYVLIDLDLSGMAKQLDQWSAPTPVAFQPGSDNMV